MPASSELAKRSSSFGEQGEEEMKELWTKSQTSNF